MRIFVYGTLMSNRCNNYLCRKAEFLGPAWIWGDKYRELAVEIPEELILAKGSYDLKKDNEIEQQFKNVEMKSPLDNKKRNKVKGEVYEFNNIDDLIPIERLEGHTEDNIFSFYNRDLTVAELKGGKYIAVWIYNIPRKRMEIW